MRLAMSLVGGAMLCAVAGASAQTAAPAASAARPTGPLSTATLANLCSVTATDKETSEAVGFCRGFLIGAWQYHMEITQPGGQRPIFCLPTPAPTVEAAQASFVTWAGGHTEFSGERALDGLMRWAASTYPCAAPTGRSSNR